MRAELAAPALAVASGGRRLGGSRAKRRGPRRARAAGSIPRHRHADPPVVAQQRHRRDLQRSSSGERPARRSSKRRSHEGQVSMPRRRHRGGVEARRGTSRTRCGRRAGCRRTLATSRSAPATVTAPSCPAPARRPRGPSRRPARPRTAVRTRSDRQLEPPGRGAGSLHALDLEALEVGRRLLERLLDRQLERRLRRRAALAVPDQPHPGHAVLDADQLDVAAVRLHVRPHALERLLHARLEVDRVEAVDQQEARDDPVLDEPLARRRRSRRARRAPRRSARARRRRAG